MLLSSDAIFHRFFFLAFICHTLTFLPVDQTKEKSLLSICNSLLPVLSLNKQNGFLTYWSSKNRIPVLLVFANYCTVDLPLPANKVSLRKILVCTISIFQTFLLKKKKEILKKQFEKERSMYQVLNATSVIKTWFRCTLIISAKINI